MKRILLYSILFFTSAILPMSVHAQTNQGSRKPKAKKINIDSKQGSKSRQAQNQKQKELDLELEVKRQQELKEQEAQQLKEQQRQRNNQQANPESIFRNVEQPPQFPGGERRLMECLRANLYYPEYAQKNNIEGRVVVQFVVEKDGSVGEVKVVHSVHPSLDVEAMRICRTLPRFTPGRQNGQPVRVWYILPVNFRLTR